jgi:iron complex outermembrane receptor protein
MKVGMLGMPIMMGGKNFNDPQLSGQSLDKDSSFKQFGLFGEAKFLFAEDSRIVAGYRTDFWRAKDKRLASYAANTMGSDTAGQSRSETLNSGFARYEKDIQELPITLYAGLGHSERFPDYWELISAHRGLAGDDGVSSAFKSTKEEKTNQIDLGFISNSNKISYSGSVFYNNINDYILMDYTAAYKGMWNMGGAARNINAYTYGAEFDAAYKLNDEWKATAALAYVRGRNQTDDKD